MQQVYNSGEKFVQFYETMSTNLQTDLLNASEQQDHLQIEIELRTENAELKATINELKAKVEELEMKMGT